jgi:hypothetical protein
VRCAVPVAERSVRRRNECPGARISPSAFRPLERGRGHRSAMSLPPTFNHTPTPSPRRSRDRHKPGVERQRHPRIIVKISSTPEGVPEIGGSEALSLYFIAPSNSLHRRWVGRAVLCAPQTAGTARLFGGAQRTARPTMLRCEISGLAFTSASTDKQIPSAPIPVRFFAAPKSP